MITNAVRKPRRRRLVLGGLCLFGSVASIASTASAQTICPMPGGSAAAAPAAGADQSKPPVAPLSRALWEADRLRRDGRTDQADAGYRKLLTAAPDRRQTARRAAIRLAQSAMTRDAYGEARDYLDRAGRPGAQPELREQIDRLRATIAYREGVDAARARFAAVDAARDAGADPTPLIERYRILLAQDCPYPDDFPPRLHWRIAQTLASTGDFGGADQELAAAEAALPAPLRQTEKGAELVGQLAQAKTDLGAERELARAEPLQESDPPAARTALTGVITASPPPSPRLIERARYRLAANLGAAGDFAGAREQLALVRAALDPADPVAPTRLAEEEQRLAQREIDAGAREKLAAADAMRVTRPQAAIATYRGVIDQSPAVSPALRDSTRLDLADTLRRERFYAQGRAELAQLSNPPATPAIAERATLIGQRFDADTPQSDFSGEIGGGLFYDSNAPALATAQRTEVDDTGFPNDQRFDDGSVLLNARLDYRHKLSENYDYWLVSGAASRSIQFDLSRLDSLVIETATGPVFNLPEQRMTITLNGIYDYRRRGGDFLQENYGVFAAVQKRFDPGLEATLSYALTKRNDRVATLDGHNHDIQASLLADLGGGHDIRPLLRIQRRDVERATLDTWRTGGELRYRYSWGDADVALYGFSIAPEYQHISYRQGPPPASKRKDERFDLTAELWMRLKRSIEIALEYRRLDIDSNFASGERLPDNRIGLTTRWIF